MQSGLGIRQACGKKKNSQNVTRVHTNLTFRFAFDVDPKAVAEVPPPVFSGFGGRGAKILFCTLNAKP